MKTKLARTEGSQRIQKKKLLIPLFLVALMVFSAFAVLLSGSGPAPSIDGTLEYKGATFTPQGLGWRATLDGRPLVIRYSPLELEGVFTEVDLSPLHAILAADKTYVSIVPGEKLQIPLQEFYANLKPSIPNLFLACTEDGEGCEELPLKTCADATATASVLVLHEGSADGDFSLHAAPNCVTLTGSELDLTQFIDKLLLSLHGL